MNREYKIFKQSYINEYGKETITYYYIKESRKFLGITFWFEIKHEICGMGDCYNVRTRFDTIEKAETFIKETLCPRKGSDKWIKEEIKNVSC
jgi:hypothetical protein